MIDSPPNLTVEDIKELQYALGLIDLCNRPSSRDGMIEVLVVQLGHIKVRMRPEKNHTRGHFHIEYKKQYSASYAIDTCELLAGQMPKRYEKPVLDWTKGKSEKLQVVWERLQAGENVQEIVIEIEKS